jgi:hypothetical protein
MTSKFVGRAVTVTVWMTMGMSAARAAGPVTVDWHNVCRTARDRELSLTTQAGETVHGYCMSINVDEIAITTQDHRVVKIARSTLARIRVRRAGAKGHQLASLGRGMREGLQTGFKWLLTPAAPVAIVLVPGTLAWGAFAAPFCALGDLSNKIGGSEEIKVL